MTRRSDGQLGVLRAVQAVVRVARKPQGILPANDCSGGFHVRRGSYPTR